MLPRLERSVRLFTWVLQKHRGSGQLCHYSGGSQLPTRRGTSMENRHAYFVADGIMCARRDARLGPIVIGVNAFQASNIQAELVLCHLSFGG